MGWKGTMRSFAAAARAAERNAIKHQRELQQRRKASEKMQELERAAYEVEVYENELEVLLTFHKETRENVDWSGIASSKAPTKPKRTQANEANARRKLSNFSPGLVDKLLRRVDRKVSRLRTDVENAKRTDENDYQRALKQYEQSHAEWEESRSLAERVIGGDHEAYAVALERLNSFEDLSSLGSSVAFNVLNSKTVEAVIRVHGEDVVPKQSKSLLRSGRLSVKPLPKGKFYELYQDHVCSAVLRIAHETLAMLPIDTVVVHAEDELLNGATGQLEETPILSLAVPRATLARLNLEKIDPSDALRNFVHSMDFKKTTGFRPTDRVTIEDADSR